MYTKWIELLVSFRRSNLCVRNTSLNLGVSKSTTTQKFLIGLIGNTVGSNVVGIMVQKQRRHSFKEKTNLILANRTPN